MDKLPSDLQILNAIYKRYYPEFARSHNRWAENDDDRIAGAYMQVDVADVAADLKADANVVFGRLYYYLEGKYKRKEDHVSLFALNLGGKQHCVNMLYLSSVLSEMRREHGRWWWTMFFTAFSVVISIVALISSIWAAALASK